MVRSPCLSPLPWFWAFTLLSSYLSHKSSTEPFCFPDLKEGNLKNSHRFTLHKLVCQPSKVNGEMWELSEQLCPSKFRALNACKWLNWTLELGAKNRKQKYPSSEITEVNWFKWKQVIKKGSLADILRENLDLPEFYKLLPVNTVTEVLLHMQTMKRKYWSYLYTIVIHLPNLGNFWHWLALPNDNTKYYHTDFLWSPHPMWTSVSPNEVHDF